MLETLNVQLFNMSVMFKENMSGSYLNIYSSTLKYILNDGRF